MIETPYDQTVSTAPVRRARSRRRTVGWAAFGLAGLILTATWAAGVTPTDPGTGSATTASPALSGAPAGDTAALDGKISVTGLDPSLPMGFVGRWGNIPVDITDSGAGDSDDNTSTTAKGDYELFEVNLTSFAATRDFFVELAISNEPDDFTALQIKFVKVDTACATADLDNTGAAGYATATLYVETSDSTAVLTMPNSGTKTVCIGVADTDGETADDPTGTFVRRASGSGTAPDPMPAFFAILGEYTAP